MTSAGSFVSNIYCKNCKELLEKETTIRFSIVIPARNSGAFLRHTIQTVCFIANIPNKLFYRFAIHFILQD